MTQLYGVAHARRTAGASYAFLGGGRLEGMRTFREIYVDEGRSDRDIAQIMARFLGKIWQETVQASRKETVDLGVQYPRQLSMTIEKLHNRASQLHHGVLTDPLLHFSQMNRSIPNPVLWATPYGQFRSMSMQTRVALCHGDLHSENMLVDQHDDQHGHKYDQIWLIDFARMAESHIFRDLAELETDIKFALQPYTDLNSIVQLETALLSETGESPPTALFAEFPALNRAYGLISNLRNIARNHALVQHGKQEYTLALFWHTLNVMRLRRFSEARRRQALVSAGLIYEWLHA